MRRARPDHIHPIGCTCRACAPRACRSRRVDLAIKCATRALFLIAALIAIPFVIAHFFAANSGEQR